MKQIRNILAVIAIIGGLWVLKMTSALSIPLAVAVFLFFTVTPLLSAMDKARIPHFLTNLIVLVMFAIVLVLLGSFFVQATNTILLKIPEYTDRVRDFDHWMTEFIYTTFGFKLDTTFISSLSVDWVGLVKKSLSSVSTSVIDISSTLVMIFLYLFFLMLERHSFSKKLIVAFQEKSGHKVWLLVGKVNRQVSKYLGIKAIISFATGVCIYFACFLFNVDFALFWGAAGFILNFIPSVGSILITVIVAIVAAVQYVPNWGPVIGVTVTITMIEMIIGNVIDPRVSGDKLNLSPFVILISMTMWGYIWGVVGMFLAVPLMSIIQIICWNIESLKPIAILISNEKYRGLQVTLPKEN